MKKNVLSLAILFLCHLSFAQWKNVPTGFPFAYIDASFADTSNAVIVGGYNIIVTHNGGSSWQLFNYPSWVFLSIDYAGDSTFFVAAKNDTDDHQTLVLRSIDIGTSWAVLNPIGANEMVNQIDFINRDTGMVAFENGFYKTLNGGLNWFALNGPATGINWFKMFNKDSIKVAQSDFLAFVYQSINGGNTWEILNYADPLILVDGLQRQAFSFPDWQHGRFASTSYNFSNDGGSTWSSNQFYNDGNDQIDLHRIESPSDSVSYIWGYDYNPPPHEIILKEKNQGQIWTKTDFPDTINSLKSLHCLNDSFCYAVTYFGQLYVTKNGGGIVGISEPTENNFVFSVFPNPSDNEFTLTSSMNGTAVITNDLGQVMLSISIHAKQQNFSTADFPSGIYFVTFHSDKFTQTKKLLIQH